jgi:hypothetical protein
VFRGRNTFIAAGVALIVLGIGALIGSYTLAHGAHALAQEWWEGTLQALGVRAPDIAQEFMQCRGVL